MGQSLQVGEDLLTIYVISIPCVINTTTFGVTFNFNIQFGQLKRYGLFTQNQARDVTLGSNSGFCNPPLATERSENGACMESCWTLLSSQQTNILLLICGKDFLAILVFSPYVTNLCFGALM